MFAFSIRHSVILTKLDRLTVLGALSILGWAIKGVLPSEDVTSAISTSVYGLGAATTIVVTALATARLLLVRRYHIELMGKLRSKFLTFYLTVQPFTRKI